MDIQTGASKGRRGGKKNRKFNRMNRRPGHARYLNEMRWLKNKANRLRRHLKAQPNDKCAARALKKL